MIVNLKNQTDLSGLYFIYYGSTNLEKPGWRGISHMGEHLFCKNFEDLQDELQENGISWNAYTTDNEIVFHFTGIEEYLAPYRDVLVKRLSEIRLTEEEVMKEKNIVLQEYLDCFTDQSQAFRLNYLRRKHGSYEAIGLKEDIEKFTYQDFIDFFEVQYKHPDKLVNVSKDFTYQNDNIVFVDRKQHFRTDWTGDDSVILEAMPSTEVDKTCVILEREVEKQDMPIMTIINALLSNGLNSPLYQEVREKRGLVYFLYCYTYALGNKYIQQIYTMTSDKNVKTYFDTIDEVFSNRALHLTEKRLETVRKAMIISRKKAMINRHSNIDDIIYPQLAESYKLLDTVTLEQINEVYDKYFIFSEFEKCTDKNFAI